MELSMLTFFVNSARWECWSRCTRKLAKNISNSPTGNWTPVSRVTGGDTHHYTIEDGLLMTTFWTFSTITITRWTLCLIGLRGCIWRSAVIWNGCLHFGCAIVEKIFVPQVRIELTTSAFLWAPPSARTENGDTDYKYGALTDCATGAAVKIPI